MALTYFRKTDNAEVKAILYLSDTQIPEIQELFAGDIEINIKKDRWDRSILSVEIWGDLGLFKYQPAKIGDWIVSEPNYNKVPWPVVYSELAFNKRFRLDTTNLVEVEEKEMSKSDVAQVHTVPFKFGKDEWESISDFLQPAYSGAGVQVSMEVVHRWNTKSGKTLQKITLALPYGGNLLLYPGDAIVVYKGHIMVTPRPTISQPIPVNED